MLLANNDFFLWKNNKKLRKDDAANREDSHRRL